jgi:predicted HAD superfamily Cof-like phosphohydrolase
VTAADIVRELRTKGLINSADSKRVEEIVAQGIDPEQRVASMVREFHERFGQPIRERPTIPAEGERVLRATLVREESVELRRELLHKGSVGKVARETADLVYVCYGEALHYGYNLDAALAEVHASNMRKLWPDGMARYRLDGKPLKPPDFEPPDMLRAIGVA